MAKKVPIGKQKLYFNIDFMNIADLLNKRCHPSLQGCMSPWDRLRKRDPRFPIEEKILLEETRLLLVIPPLVHWLWPPH